nr:DExH-box ATP-dependent RNA helicase DExH12-like [Ipomoea batatas]
MVFRSSGDWPASQHNRKTRKYDVEYYWLSLKILYISIAQIRFLISRSNFPDKFLHLWQTESLNHLVLLKTYPVIRPKMGGGIEDDVMQEANDGMTLMNVQDIDAYWLQRKISQAYKQ